MEGHRPGLLRLLTPHPHRGDVIAAGAVPLALCVVLLQLRLDGDWPAWLLAGLALAVAALLLAMGLLAPLEGRAPRSYQTVLLVSGLGLLALGLQRACDAAGAHWGPGQVLGIGTAVAFLAGIASSRRGSPVALLITLVAAGAALLALVDVVLDAPGLGWFRLVALVMAGVSITRALAHQVRRPGHARQAVNAAGVWSVVLALLLMDGFGSLVLGLIGSDVGVAVGGGGPGFGWSLAVLGCGLGLVAYGGVERAGGPGGLGVLVLLLWAIDVGDGGILGWPLLLLALGVTGLAIGLRPLRPLPPEPSLRQSSPADPGGAPVVRPLRDGEPPGLRDG